MNKHETDLTTTAAESAAPVEPTAGPAAGSAAGPAARPAARPRTAIGQGIRRFLRSGAVVAIVTVVAIAALVGGMLRFLPGHTDLNPMPGSVESIAWHTAAQPPNVHFDFGPYFARYGDRELMAGTSLAGGNATAGSTAAGNVTTVWSSADGSTWSLISDSGSFGTDGKFTALGMSDDGAGGLVIVGNWFGTSGKSVTAMAWYSRDGRVWTPANVNSAGGAQMLGVAARPGVVVAAGNSGAWYSPDGRSWAQEALPGVEKGYSPRVVGAWDGGFAIVAAWAGAGPATSKVWVSEDGQTWVEAGTSLTGFAPREIVGAGDRIVAVGSDAGDSTTGVAVSWTSSDGDTWTKVSAPVSQPAVPMNAVIQYGDNLLAVGDSGIAHNPDAAAAASPPLSIWVSGAPGTWQLLPGGPPSLSNAHIAGLGDQLIVVGVTPSGSMGVYVGDPTMGPAAAASGAGAPGTGLALRVQAGAEPMIPDLTAAAALGPVVATGDRFFTFVSNAAGTAVWSSPDGQLWAQEAAPTGLVPAKSTAKPIVMAAVSDGSGGVVAVGRLSSSSGDAAAAWSYTKAAGWKAAKIAGTAPPELWSVAVHAGNFVASTDSPKGARIIYSVGGSTWQAGAITGADGYALTVAAWSGGFVAKGSDQSSAAATRVWTSADGKDWTQRPDWFAPAHAVALFGLGNGLMAATTDANALTTWWRSSDGVAWVQTGPKMEAAAWTIVASGLVVMQKPAASGGAWLVWETADGSSWQRGAVTGVSLKNGTACRLAALGTTLVIVGFSPAGSMTDYHGPFNG